MFSMFLLLVLFVTVTNIREVGAGQPVDYEVLDLVTCWECVTESADGYRLTRKNRGKTNFFALLSPNGEIANFTVHIARPDKILLRGHKTMDNLPIDVKLVADAHDEWFQKQCEKIIDLPTLADKLLHLGFSLDEENHVQTASFHGEKVRISNDGSVDVIQHHGRPVLPNVYEALDKENQKSFLPLNHEVFDTGVQLQGARKKLPEASRMPLNQIVNESVVSDVPASKGNMCVVDRRSVAVRSKEETLLSSVPSGEDSASRARPVRRCFAVSDSTSVILGEYRHVSVYLSGLIPDRVEIVFPLCCK